MQQWRSLNPPLPSSAMPSQMGGPDRREFLTLMAASLALAGASGCSPAATLPEKILPYAEAPERTLPGIPLHFATTMPLDGYGCGLIVESREGRPIKVEGNPRHPASLGAANVFAQASTLQFYDPDRARAITRDGLISTFDAFVDHVTTRIDTERDRRGAGLRFLTPAITSPSIAAAMEQLMAALPDAGWHVYDPVNRDTARAGAMMAFGRPLDAIYDFTSADVILSLDADFLQFGPAHLRYTREFTERRAVAPGAGAMNRLYVVEASPTITGAKADHRAAMRSPDILRFTAAIASHLAVDGVAPAAFDAAWFEPLMRDLESHHGRSLVIAGDTQPAEIHALAHGANERLGNIGRTVRMVQPVEARPEDRGQSLQQLVKDIRAGAVEMLVIFNGNPVYSAPADLEFAKELERVPLRIHFNDYYDETSRLCQWHVPAHHFLETWGDARAFDGTASIIQPLMNPLYQSKSALEFLNVFLGNPTLSNYELVRDYWRMRYRDRGFEEIWSQSVQTGVVDDNTFAAIPVNAAVRLKPETITLDSPDPAPAAGAMELVFRPDPCIYDGQFANNGWLLELPHPLTKLTWDNAVLLSPATASRLGVSNGDNVTVTAGVRQVTGAAWIAPGHADRSATIHLGWGRPNAGNVGAGRGFNAYAIRASSRPWIVSDARVERAAGTSELVSTQHHEGPAGRHMARYITETRYAEAPDSVREEEYTPEEHETMYPAYRNADYAWGMSIDLSRCVGCNACVTACQAENNIPVVGKREVSRGREMHWMRIDTYYEGPPDSPDAYFQPMLCQHCETAPCELVCPVEATSHSAEGLNEMTYNRCVGTRYCSNNCPYKVRRFNFLAYADWNSPPSLKLLNNPEVSVRSRGVMEKCTYCVQRISRARINAEKQNRTIRDGEIVTACQATCPADAIVFGNILDPDARVSLRKAEPRDYGVLAELNTRPRTTYLAALKNPNPEIATFDYREES